MKPPSSPAPGPKARQGRAKPAGEAPAPGPKARPAQDPATEPAPGPKARRGRAKPAGEPPAPGQRARQVQDPTTEPAPGPKARQGRAKPAGEAPAPGLRARLAQGRRRLLGRGLGTPYRAWASLRFLATRDRAAAQAFLTARYPFDWPLAARLVYLGRLLRATQRVRGFHTLAELLTVSDRIFARAGTPGLTVVEAGAGPGGSTVKLSLAVRKAGGRLIVYDSFRGIPPNQERHRHLDGREIVFRTGAFTGRLGAVRRAVARYGAPEVCEFRKGWFEDTLPLHTEPVHVALLDVDLRSSTQVCLQNLYPKLADGGVIFSQDGHLEAIQGLMVDPEFWRPLGGPPRVLGLGQDKLLELRAPRA